jgi:ABC-type Fe3+-hydroxamate transport system substrate-binding protein
LRRSIALAAVAAALAIMLAACGGTSGSDTSAEATKTPYTNAQYGFTITYSEPLSLITLTPSGGEEYTVAFADKDGRSIENEYANGLRVAVYKLDKAVKAADVPKLQDGLQKAIEKMVAAVPDGKMTGTVNPTEINGTPGYYADYQYTKGGEQITCRTYILLKGKYEYDLTTQAVTQDWASLKGTLEETVQTFTLD